MKKGRYGLLFKHTDGKPVLAAGKPYLKELVNGWWVNTSPTSVDTSSLEEMEALVKSQTRIYGKTTKYGVIRIG